MHKKIIAVFVAILTLGAVLLVLFLGNNQLVLLSPEGAVAGRQRDIIVFTTLLSMVVIVPVFSLLAFIAWRYRVGNKKAAYTPDWDHHHGLEFVWWAVPCIIILILAVVTWRTSHELDPYRPLDSAKEPVTIQVVALQWRWLFIYPDEGIATVNFVRFPEDTPVNFRITADAPMNSFWIPQLSGQVYAMNGMQTKLHVIADKPGVYDGSSANISGEGFADMRFTAQSSTRAEYDAWVQEVRQSFSEHLTFAAYEQLAKPNRDTTKLQYAGHESGLYNRIMMKYMDHTHDADNAVGHHE